MKRNKSSKFYSFVFIIGVFLIFIFMNTLKIQALSSVHQCSYCHNMHAPQGPVLLSDINAENTCLTCHAPGGSSSLKAAVHEYTSYGGFRHTCLDCHDAHDNQQNILSSYNIKLVLASVDTPNSGPDWDVIFISRGSDVGDPVEYSFADGDSNYDGICEVCHTQTRFHRNDGSGRGRRHRSGRTCTLSNCHSHLNGFIR